MTWMVTAGIVRFEHVPEPRSLAEADENRHRLRADTLLVDIWSETI
jgi:hypothetical protein